MKFRMPRVCKDGSYLIMIIYRVFLVNYAAGEISNLRNIRFFTIIVKSYYRIHLQNNSMHITLYENLNDIHFDTVFCAKFN